MQISEELPLKKIILPCAAVILLAAVALLLPDYMAGQLKSALRSEGFTVVSIGKTRFHLSGVEFADIRLDRNGNSTIDSVRVPFSLGQPSRLTISGATLTGELGPGGLPVVDGWEWKSVSFPSSLRHVALDNVKLDIMTPAGAIRIEAKGQMTPASGHSRHIDAAIFGDQKQLTLDTHWDMNWNPDGSWSAEGEIESLRVRLDHFELTRGSGWLTLSGTSRTSLLTSGQIAAGLVTLGPLAVHNANLVINGPLGGLDLILGGQTAGQPPLQLTAETRQTDVSTTVHSTLTATNLDAISDFLVKLHDGLEANRPAGGLLMSLLLTQGNLDRIRKELKAIDYETLTLTLDGPPDDLGGSITATHTVNGAARKHVVSFNPVAGGR